MDILKPKLLRAFFHNSPTEQPITTYTSFAISQPRYRAIMQLQTTQLPRLEQALLDLLSTLPTSGTELVGSITTFRTNRQQQHLGSQLECVIGSGMDVWGNGRG